MVEKANAREGILELLREDPHIGAAEAGRALDITRQRAHQLLEELRPEVEASPDKFQRIAQTASLLNSAVLLEAAADLASRGWQIFVPIAHSSQTCDLVAVSKDGKKVERIEVRVAKRRLGEVQFTEPHGGVFDRLALVIAGEPVLYRPAFKHEAKT